MNRRRGPVGNLLCSLVALIAGSVFVANALITQQALNDRGVTGRAEVVAVNHDWGRMSQDSIDVRLVGSDYKDLINLTRFDDRAEVGDEITLRYDRADPAWAVQDGVSTWGFIESLMLLLGIAGLVGTAHATYSLANRPRRRPFTPAHRVDTAVQNSPAVWAPKNGKRRHKR